MSKAYDEYLEEHIGNVVWAYDWLVDHFGEKYGFAPNFFRATKLVEDHDKSKYSEMEYLAYDDYFYGHDKSDDVTDRFNKAWLHHIHNNPHHWQHWVLLKDDPEHADEPYVCIEMPIHYVFEMIADWWSFSRKANKLTEIFSWYDAHKDIMKLHPNTRQLVESILKDMSSII